MANAIAAAVRDGQLLPGDRLPTHRAVARHLTIDGVTVSHGYAEANRNGLLTATVGRGTFVARAAGALGGRPS
nr:MULTISPECIES: GntR family transcriptional regulator [unclassified Acidisoma]